MLAISHTTPDRRLSGGLLKRNINWKLSIIPATKGRTVDHLPPQNFHLNLGLRQLLGQRGAEGCWRDKSDSIASPGAPGLLLHHWVRQEWRFHRRAWCDFSCEVLTLLWRLNGILSTKLFVKCSQDFARKTSPIRADRTVEDSGVVGIILG